MPRRIESLALERFRGATCAVKLRFDTGKPVVLLFGENGTGKSTLVDAIDFVCNEQYGSLAEKSSAKPKSYLPSLGAKSGDVSVSLHCGGNEWKGELGTGGPAVSGPRDRPRARILRRSQILCVVNAEPKQRYGVLRAFVDVGNIERCENALRDAIRAVETEYNDAVKAREQARESLDKLWRTEGRPGKDSVSWATERAAVDPGDLGNGIEAIGKILRAVQECANASRDHAKATKAHRLGGQQLAQAEKALHDAQSQAASQDAKMVSLLEEAIAFVKGRTDLKSCPVCEQGVDGKQLKKRLTARLDSLKELLASKQAHDTAKSAAKSSEAVLRDRTDSLVRAGKALAGILSGSSVSKVDTSRFPGLLAAGEPSDPDAAAQEATDLLAEVEKHVAGMTKQRHADQKTLNQLTALKGHCETLKEKEGEVKDKHDVLQRLKAFLAVVEEQRKGYVDEVLASVSASVEDLYSKVHPKEDIGKVRFYLNPKFQGSLEFDGQFQTATGVPPQAYYSDSHLDTLGICIFLALAKQEKGAIVVLDDPITSADHDHMERLIDMLHDEAASFDQLIVATHYRPWRDRYRFGRAPSGQTHVIELQDWSLPRGITRRDRGVALDDLRKALSARPFERDIVAAKAGIVLESLLCHVTRCYACRLPFKPGGDHTLGDYLSGVSSKLGKVLKAVKPGSGPDVPLAPMLEDIRTMTWVRNQVGAHFCPDANVSDTEVKQLAQKTLELGDSLVCADCGELPWRNKSGSYLECRCGKAQMHPVMEPS